MASSHVLLSTTFKKQAELLPKAIVKVIEKTLLILTTLRKIDIILYKFFVRELTIVNIRDRLEHSLNCFLICLNKMLHYDFSK